MFDRRTIHTLGTVSVASGVALLVLSVPAVLLGTVEIVSHATTVGEAVDALRRSIPADGFVLGTAQTTLTLGLLGLGVSFWLLGIGLLLQGRAEV